MGRHYIKNARAADSYRRLMLNCLPEDFPIRPAGALDSAWRGAHSFMDVCSFKCRPGAHEQQVTFPLATRLISVFVPISIAITLPDDFHASVASSMDT